MTVETSSSSCLRVRTDSSFKTLPESEDPQHLWSLSLCESLRRVDAREELQVSGYTCHQVGLKRPDRGVGSHSSCMAGSRWPDKTMVQLGYFFRLLGGVFSLKTFGETRENGVIDANASGLSRLSH